MSQGLDKFIKMINANYGEIINEAQLSKLLGISKMALFKMRRRKDCIPFFRIGKLINYFKHDVIEWLKTCQSKTINSKIEK